MGGEPRTAGGSAAVLNGTLRRRVLIIANPAAGRPRASRRHLERVVQALQRRGCAVTLQYSAPEPGSAEHLARSAGNDFDVIVAAGGDGTLNAVVNGRVGLAQPIALLPFGTANVVARELRLPRQPQALAALIAAGRIRQVWPGRAGGRLFLAMASAGFDAELVAAVDSRLKRRTGRFAFAWALLLAFLRYRPCEISVRIEGAEHRAATVIAAKGPFYGGPFVVAPQAGLVEPMLDFVLLRRSGRLAILRCLGALPLELLPRLRDVTILRARDAFVTAEKPVPLQADGEIVGRLPASIAVSDQPIWLVWP